MQLEEFIKKTKSWPFIEALKLKKKLEFEKSNDIVLFETGYGPSGTPHIGTFAEVLRTNMVRAAFEKISDKPTKLIAFSDDMDGLRKVPDNVPNPKMLLENLHKPLSAIPDPYGKFSSFAERNNELLKSFLNKFNFEYEFMSASHCYKEGIFDDVLLKILKNYEEIVSIVIPTLGDERKKSYSPFLPICKKSGKVLQVPINIIDDKKGIIAYKNDSNQYEESIITGGSCKLQWKVDWAMRWVALGINYEMNGKDLIPSFQLSKKIAQVLRGSSPVNMSYELFLDEKGEKISKSKGNGLTIDEWLKYGTKESLSLFMYQNPKRAKRLYFDCIPTAVDEYKNYSDIYHGQQELEKLDNPVWHINKDNSAKTKNSIEFSMLLNLVTASNSQDENTLLGFVKKYDANNNFNYESIKYLIPLALNYFRDFILPKRNYKKPNVDEGNALNDLYNEILNIPSNASGEEYQKLVYRCGKDHYPDNLKVWFKSLYSILLGSDSGPRIGSFFSFYGKEQVLKLIQEAKEGTLSRRNI